MKRKNYGLRFIKAHEIAWLVSSETLRAQTSMSLMDRSKHFQREFPGAKMNPTLLRQIYQRNRIKKRKLRWHKTPKEYDPDKAK